MAWWNLGTSPPNLPKPNRQANQAGFFGNGDIWSVGGINGATFQFLNEVWHRNNGGGGCAVQHQRPQLVRRQRLRRRRPAARHALQS